MLCRERREISLTVLLVCHEVTGRSYEKSPALKWHNQPGKKLLLKSLVSLDRLRKHKKERLLVV